jgi:hypothetical protein
MTIKADISLWILTKFLSPPVLDHSEENFFNGRILTIRFLFGYLLTLVSLGYTWNIQGFKSSKNKVKIFLGYVIFLVMLSMYIMDAGFLYEPYWYKEHLGKLVVWYKLSEIVLDVFTMTQCTLSEREDIRIIGGYAAISYSLTFVEILLIWFGVTV